MGFAPVANAASLGIEVESQICGMPSTASLQAYLFPVCGIRQRRGDFLHCL
jgi:hypothetical protein